MKNLKKEMIVQNYEDFALKKRNIHPIASLAWMAMQAHRKISSFLINELNESVNC